MTDPGLESDVPHAARMWNYWMGGTDNFPADRAAGDAVAQVYPEIALMARESRRFLIRVVRHLSTEAGISQFLDIGTGLPTMQNTHEVAPGARVVYVDKDPLVLTYASKLPDRATYVHADYHEPDLILTEAAKTLDLSRPVAVMFMGVLGYEPDLDVARSIVSRTVAALPAGSHLVLWDGTNTTAAVVEGAERLANSGGVPYILRAPTDLKSLFGDLALLDPGLVPITRWRPEEPAPSYIDAYGATARIS
ncbi:SAM-dependent methyltransferase [Actinoplanes sp. GCM10030250]|uniref:SAM-dependent methyltransferase n=1 Tax=Actinoplanes sp. GCM10030250 TaxID=3273376 RepID=UPI003614A93E